MYLLLGEICETVQNDGLETVLPSIVAEVAAQMVTIIADPSHKMYSKVNKFLNRAPSWDVRKVVTYWIDRILLKEPEDDDGHDSEVNWLLRLLANGLRNAKVGIQLGWPAIDHQAFILR
jgi:nucleolar pre-ribosomal-associated protein 1